MKLIKQYKSIEGVIAQMRKEKKYDIPPDWLPMRIRKNVASSVQEEEGEEAVGEAENGDDEKGLAGEGQADFSIDSVGDPNNSEKEKPVEISEDPQVLAPSSKDSSGSFFLKNIRIC